MSSQHLAIRELAGWDFDDPVDRGSCTPEQLWQEAPSARRRPKECKPYRAESPISREQTQQLTDALAARKKAVARSGEFDGLAWELAVVDLRRPIAFRRRIGFMNHDHFEIEDGAGWPQLLDLALPVHLRSKSPYIEVTSYRDRWLLRDGYHRSFRLLRRGINLVPAVVLYAKTLAEMAPSTASFSLRKSSFRGGLQR